MFILWKGNSRVPPPPCSLFLLRLRINNSNILKNNNKKKLKSKKDIPFLWQTNPIKSEKWETTTSINAFTRVRSLNTLYLTKQNNIETSNNNERKTKKADDNQFNNHKYKFPTILYFLNNWIITTTKLFQNLRYDKAVHFFLGGGASPRSSATSWSISSRKVSCLTA